MCRSNLIQAVVNSWTVYKFGVDSLTSYALRPDWEHSYRPRGPYNRMVNPHIDIIMGQKGRRAYGDSAAQSEWLFSDLGSVN